MEGRLRISWSLGSWLPVLRRLPDGGPKQIALTIDDAPTPDATPQMLDLLDRFGAKATFFLSGCRAEPHLDLVAEINRRGHQIYAHGWEHIRLDRAGPERLILDMDRCEALLSRFRPTPFPYLVRLPQNGGYRNTTVHRALARWQPGCQFAHWGASTEDHLISPRCTSAADVEPECRKEVDRLLAAPHLSGAILLMHDQPINERPGAEHKAAVTVTLTRLLLEGLTAAGFGFAPITPLAAQPVWARFALI
ncbi:MAG: polysaccharide deacetylase family protein [Rhodospirillaceae bacterium]|nr:polysaccharide deacetylase family protein [Rhodospirillales bacterium]